MACQPLPNEGLVGGFSPTTVVPSSPPSYRPARLVGEKTPTDLSHPFGNVIYKTELKEGHWRKKAAAVARSTGFFAIFALKTKLF